MRKLVLLQTELKRATTARGEGTLQQMALKNRKRERASELFRSHNITVSTRTVRGRLVESGLG